MSLPNPTFAGQEATVAGKTYEAVSVNPPVWKAVTTGTHGRRLDDLEGKHTKSVNVLNFFTEAEYIAAKDGNLSVNHSPAFQRAVDYSIAQNIKSIFIPHTGFKYRLDETVVAEISGFYIEGDCSVGYLDLTQPNGYITGDAALNGGYFNLGNDTATLSSNQVTAKRVAFYRPTTGGRLGVCVAHRYNNNGPHRGVRIQECCASGFDEVFTFESANPSNLSVASVVIEGGAYRSNNYVANAKTRGFGLLVNGAQSEQGARYTGMWDGPITITDNMLEGQDNVLNFDSNAPIVKIDQNYMEQCMGDYFARVKGTNGFATAEFGTNYVSRIESVDFYRVEFVCTLLADEDKSRSNTWQSVDRRTLITLYNATLAPRSSFNGKFYTATDGNGAQGYCDPAKITQAKPDGALSVGFVGQNAQTTGTGTVSAPTVCETPLGRYTKCAVYNGYPSVYRNIALSYNANDLVVVCALVKANSSTSPRFDCSNEAFTSIGVSCGQLSFNNYMEDQWYLMFAVDKASNAGTSLNVRFGSNGTESTGNDLIVASLGAYVIPQSEFVNLGTQAESRAFVQLFVPNLPTDYIEFTEPSAGFTVAAGGSNYIQKAIQGARIGDVFEASYSEPTGDLIMSTKCNVNNIVRTTFTNTTGAGITLGAGTLTYKYRN